MAGQNQTGNPKKTPVCVYWDPDVGVYRIYLARRVRGIGWIEDSYLGSAKNVAELIRIMSIFNYIKVCGIDVRTDATRRRDAADDDAGCDAVMWMVGAC